MESLTIRDAVTTASGGGVLALALDPQFARTRLVYVVDAVAGRAGLEFRVSRYREAGGRLGERAVLLGGVAASNEPSAALAVAADGRLLVAFDDGGGAGGYSGSLLRLNADGTTPDGQRASPVLLTSLASPRSLAVETSDAWWMVDAGRQVLERVRIHRRTGVQRTTARVIPAASPRAAAVVPIGAVPGLERPLLVLAVDGDAPLLLAEADPSATALATEPLDVAGVDRVTAIAAGPDGAVYFATGQALVRLGLR